MRLCLRAMEEGGAAVEWSFQVQRALQSRCSEAAALRATQPRSRRTDTKVCSRNLAGEAKAPGQSDKSARRARRMQGKPPLRPKP